MSMVLSRQLLPLLERADLLAAHNASFDIGVLRSELQQISEEGGLALLESLPVFCTMVETKDIVQAKFMYVLYSVYVCMYVCICGYVCI